MVEFDIVDDVNESVDQSFDSPSKLLTGKKAIQFENAKYCQLCYMVFAILNTKKHCNFCGRTCCDKCSISIKNKGEKSNKDEGSNFKIETGELDAPVDENSKNLKKWRICELCKTK
jgi:hypothetical protein